MSGEGNVAVENGKVKLTHVPGKDNPADLFTKKLTRDQSSVGCPNPPHHCGMSRFDDQTNKKGVRQKSLTNLPVWSTSAKQ